MIVGCKIGDAKLLEFDMMLELGSTIIAILNLIWHGCFSRFRKKHHVSLADMCNHVFAQRIAIIIAKN